MPGALGGVGCLEWAFQCLCTPGLSSVILAALVCSGLAHIDLAELPPACPAGALQLPTITGITGLLTKCTRIRISVEGATSRLDLDSIGS